MIKSNLTFSLIPIVHSLIRKCKFSANFTFAKNQSLKHRPQKRSQLKPQKSERINEGKNWVMKDCLSIVIICRKLWRWMSDSFKISNEPWIVILASPFVFNSIVSLSSFSSALHFTQKEHNKPIKKYLLSLYSFLYFSSLFFSLIWWANEWLLAAGFVTSFLSLLDVDIGKSLFDCWMSTVLYFWYNEQSSEVDEWLLLQKRNIQNR